MSVRTCTAGAPDGWHWWSVSKAKKEKTTLPLLTKQQFALVVFESVLNNRKYALGSGRSQRQQVTDSERKWKQEMAICSFWIPTLSFTNSKTSLADGSDVNDVFYIMLLQKPTFIERDFFRVLKSAVCHFYEFTWIFFDYISCFLPALLFYIVFIQSLAYIFLAIFYCISPGRALRVIQVKYSCQTRLLPSSHRHSAVLAALERKFSLVNSLPFRMQNSRLKFLRAGGRLCKRWHTSLEGSSTGRKEVTRVPIVQFITFWVRKLRET